MKWGLIGASTIASEHMIGAIRDVGDDIACVLSASPERAESYATQHGIPRGHSAIEALLSDDIDAVYISTTNDKHLGQALAAIAAGKHVMCEKPLALNLADAVTMVRAAQDAGVTFGTNHHLRNAGSHIAIQGLIASGRLGEILSVRMFHAVYLPPHLQGWRIDNPAAGGGVIPDITVHDADTVRFYLGEDPHSVVAMDTASGLGQGVEDSVMSVWSMPSGAMVMAHESFTHRFAGSGVEVHGTKGSVRARNVMAQVSAGEVTLITDAGEEAVPFSDHSFYARGLSRFQAAVRGEGRPAADGWDGIKSLAVATAVADAARSGQRTNVDYVGL